MTHMISFRQALNEALREEMKRDSSVYLIGEDIGTYHSGRGPSGVMEGLLAEFGDQRVIETPICEGAIAGSSIGAAMFGMRPVVEIMHSEFLVTCFQYLVYGGAKITALSNGRVKVPLVIRTQFGCKEPGQAFQDESNEAWFCHAPGLKVVMPSTPYDAKGLLTAAIRDDHPVLFLEHKALYDVVGEVPKEQYSVPLGVADVKRSGRDVTVIAMGKIVSEALNAAETLAERGIDVEVVDLRTLAPLDFDTILQSVGKTGRAVIFHEARKTGGLGGEVAALIAEAAFGDLRAPILRVGAPDVPSALPPGSDDLVAAIEAISEIIA
ncbi:MAG TPA: alpha-ketoacid dehydrogenase subunit beta [Corynebacteriales bacterium]|nr:alpha-ketoacid dehydrogenase subunit beta [Mycobacteriales bacterium]